MKLAYQTNTWGGVVGHPACRAHDIHGEAALQAFVTDRCSQRIGGFFHDAILYQFDPDKQSLSSNVTDLLMVVLEFTQPGHQILPAQSRLLNQPLFLDDIDDRESDCRRKWVRDMGGDMHEPFAVAILLDRRGSQRGRDGDASTQRLGD